MDFVAQPVHWPVGHLKDSIDAMVSSATLGGRGPWGWTNHSKPCEERCTGRPGAVRALAATWGVARCHGRAGKHLTQVIGYTGQLHYAEFVKGFDAAFASK